MNYGIDIAHIISRNQLLQSFDRFNFFSFFPLKVWFIFEVIGMRMCTFLCSFPKQQCGLNIPKIFCFETKEI